MKTIKLLGIFILAFSSLDAQETTVKERTENYLKEIYADSYNHYFSKEGSTDFYIDLVNRIEYIPLKDAPENIPNLSGLGVKDKYNPLNIEHDNYTKFDSKNFNPIKYFYNYADVVPQFFRIYKTEWVLKVNPIQKND